jgi:hypothetical protein
MKEAQRAIGLGIAGGIVGTLLAALALWLIIVYTDAYNIAATDPHTDIVRWTLDTTMQRAVANGAGDITPPKQINEESLRVGARIYAQTCAHCDGAPGAEREAWTGHMRPQRRS